MTLRYFIHTVLLCSICSTPIQIHVKDAGSYILDSIEHEFVINSTKVIGLQIQRLTGSIALHFRNATIPYILHLILRDFEEETVNISSIRSSGNLVISADRNYGTDSFQYNLTFLTVLPDCGNDCPVIKNNLPVDLVVRNCSCTLNGRLCNRVFNGTNCTSTKDSILRDVDRLPINFTFGRKMDIYTIPTGAVSLAPDEGIAVSVMGWPRSYRTQRSSLCFTTGNEREWSCKQQSSFAGQSHLLTFRACSPSNMTGYIYISNPHIGDNPELTNLSISVHRNSLMRGIRQGVVIHNTTEMSFCLGRGELLIVQSISKSNMTVLFELPYTHYSFALMEGKESHLIYGSALQPFSLYSWYSIKASCVGDTSCSTHVRVMTLSDDALALPFNITFDSGKYTFESGYRVQYYWSHNRLPRSVFMVQRLIRRREIEFSPIARIATRAMNKAFYVSCTAYLHDTDLEPFGLCEEVYLDPLDRHNHPVPVYQMPKEPTRVPTNSPVPLPSSNHQYIWIVVIAGAILVAGLVAGIVYTRSVRHRQTRLNQSILEEDIESDGSGSSKRERNIRLEIDSHNKREKPD